MAFPNKGSGSGGGGVQTVAGNTPDGSGNVDVAFSQLSAGGNLNFLGTGVEEGVGALNVENGAVAQFLATVLTTLQGKGVASLVLSRSNLEEGSSDINLINNGISGELAIALSSGNENVSLGITSASNTAAIEVGSGTGTASIIALGHNMGVGAMMDSAGSPRIGMLDDSGSVHPPLSLEVGNTHLLLANDVQALPNYALTHYLEIKANNTLLGFIPLYTNQTPV